MPPNPLGKLAPSALEKPPTFPVGTSTSNLIDSTEHLVVLGCCLLTAVTKFQGKLASLQQVSSPKIQDNFQICCADMYLVTFLANFARFRGFT